MPGGWAILESMAISTCHTPRNCAIHTTRKDAHRKRSFPDVALLSPELGASSAKICRSRYFQRGRQSGTTTSLLTASCHLRATTRVNDGRHHRVEALRIHPGTCFAKDACSHSYFLIFLQSIRVSLVASNTCYTDENAHGENLGMSRGLKETEMLRFY